MLLGFPPIKAISKSIETKPDNHHQRNCQKCGEGQCRGAVAAIAGTGEDAAANEHRITGSADIVAIIAQISRRAVANGADAP